MFVCFACTNAQTSGKYLYPVMSWKKMRRRRRQKLAQYFANIIALHVLTENFGLLLN